MVTYKEKDKDLVIPASLGNFKTNGGGGGVTPEEVQIMINTSIAGYDATVQEEFNTTNSGVSENAQNIETLSGKTQEIESALENYATTAQTSEIASGLTELSGVTEQLSQTVGDKANASDLEALSGVTGQALQNIGTLSAQTSGLSAQIEAVSGAIPTVEVEQVLSAGTKIGTVSINGVGTDLFAPEDGQKVIDLDALTQQELAALYTELNTNSGVANMQYVFYAINNNTGLSVLNGKKFRYQILEYGTEIKFEVNMTREDATYFNVLNVHLKSDGTLTKGNNFQDLNRRASSSQLGQIKVGSGLTIDGNGVLSVSGGSQSGPTVIDFDAMTQQEIATFIGELEPVWSGTSVNGEYVFLKSFRDYTPGNQGTRQMRVQFIRFQSNRAYFSTLTQNPSDQNQAIVWVLEVNSDGACSTNTSKINSQTKGTDVVGYFDDYKRTVEFNKSTSAFTYNNGTALVDGQNFGGSFYWFIVDAVAGDWGQAIPILRFKVIENGSETTYQYPSASIKDTSVTIDDVEYTKECKFDYGKFTFGMLCNANPKCANFTFTENY